MLWSVVCHWVTRLMSWGMPSGEATAIYLLPWAARAFLLVIDPKWRACTQAISYWSDCMQTLPWRKNT